MPKAKPLTVPAVYQAWFEQQMGAAAKLPTAGLPPRLVTMHRMYGATEGQTCGAYAHCIRVNGGSRDYLKCDLNKITSGAGTDWRRKWPACGKFEPMVKP